MAITASPGELVIDVRNRMRDAAPADVRPGVGTPAMQERARTVGGRVDLDALDGEFRLTAHLPVLDTTTSEV